MQINVGKIDKISRIILGAVLISLVFVGPQTQWGWLGLILLITGLTGRCPLYKIAGINTDRS